MSNLSKLTPQIRLFVKNDENGSNAIFGRGVAELCKGVQEKGSLNASAKGMHMAYSKAWRIVKETEKELGIQMLNRDGAHGSTLTEEGEKLLSAYFAVNDSVQKYAEKELAKHLG